MAEDQAAFLAKAMGMGVCAWSDALDDFGISGVILGLAQRGGGQRFAGYAVTARQEIGPLGHCLGTDFGVTRMIEATGRGQVLMVEMGGAAVSTFGGMAATAAKAAGAAAVIIDGGCRDLAEIQATGLWLASRHVVPTSGKKRAKLAALNQPITVAGVGVAGGDLVIGDETGIVVIPAADIARVTAAAEHKFAQDQIMEKTLKAGGSFAEAAKAAKYF